MNIRKVDKVHFVNELTGEVYDLFLAKRKKQIGGKWMKVWQDSPLLGRYSLHGQSYRVLLCLVNVAKWGNIIPAPPILAKLFNLNEKGTYRAYAELIKAEYVIKKDRVYYLSPLYCWKGKDKDYELAYRELLSGSIKVLSEGINTAGVLRREGWTRQKHISR